ncbi:MAG TPA: nitronate monooxygenase, partial [Candidatus Dormibacteraeota bacterium]
MRTPICDRLGIEFPIFAFSHCRDVVAAVSRAGGMGVLGAVAFSPRQLEVELTWLDEHVGGRPYGVDVLLPERFAGAEEGGGTLESLTSLIPEEHRQFVDDLLERYGVPPLPSGTSGHGWMLDVSPRGVTALLDVAFAHRPRLVASALGPAPDFLVDAAHEQGAVVAGLVGSRRHAERQHAAGV